MTPFGLLRSLATRGVHLEVQGDRLHIEAPSGALTPADIEALKAHKATILKALAGPKPQGPAHSRIEAQRASLSPEAVMSMSVAEFARAGLLVAVDSALLGRWYMASDEDCAAGLSRGLVYTPDELLAVAELPAETWAKVHRLKARAGGTVFQAVPPGTDRAGADSWKGA